MLTDTQRKLAEEHLGLAYYCACRMKNLPMELEELISLALLGLTKAAKSYNPEREVAFASYAMAAMQNEIKSGLRKESKHCGVASLNVPFYDNREEGEDLIDQLPNTRDILDTAETIIVYKELLEKLESSYTGMRKQLLQELIRSPGQSQWVYAKRLGTSQEYISRLIRKMREDVRKEFIC